MESSATRRMTARLCGALLLAYMMAPYALAQSTNAHGGTKLIPMGICMDCEPEDPPPPPPPAYASTFIAQSVPTTMVAGQAYAVSVQMRNDGTNTWTVADSYRLGSQNPADNSTWGLARVNVPASIATGQTATFNFNVTAPATAGSYNFQWKMLREGVTWFGAASSNLVVSVSAVTGSISASPSPCTFAAGATTCTSTISWTSNAANAEIWVSGPDGSNPALFARAQSGTQSAPWIQVSGARFQLKSGTSVLSTVTVYGSPPPNAAPAVSLTAPTSGQSFGSDTSIGLTASATDSDGSIQRVEFYIDNTKVGEDASSPYAYSWTTTTGAHALTAKAFDNLGTSATSSTVNITVTSPNSPPSAPTSFSRTDVITYEDNLSLWVIGQQKSSTNVETGVIESRTDYDPATALPLATYGPGTASVPGKVQQRMTYDLTSAVGTGQRGTLKTVSDGRDSGTYDTTVTLAGWKRGIPQTISFPDGTAKSAVVDDLGQILSVTDETGAKTCYAYDPMGRINKVTYPSESIADTCNTDKWSATDRSLVAVTTAEYGLSAGHWRELVTTGYARKYTYYDALWRPVLTLSYDANNYSGTLSQSVTRYDADGHVIFQSYPTATATDFQQALPGTTTKYDALGRPTQVIQTSEIGPLTTTMAYLTGFKTQVTNARGKVTTTSYKTYDQPSTDWPVAITHPEGAFTDITRDTFGKPTSLTRRNSTQSVSAVRSYTYNIYEELCRTTEPETDATLMGYDTAGNLAWSASGLPIGTACDLEGDTAAILARKTARTYDQRNRISTLSFADNRGNTTYDYEPDGLVGSLVAMDGTITVTTNYIYNNRRLLTNEQLLWGSINWNLGYTYNSNGHLATQAYPGSLTIDYAPNALGQPTKAGAYATGVSYYPNGAIKQFTYGNGIVHTLTQNDRQLPDRSLDAYGTSKTLDDNYDYDQVGNVLAITDGIDATRNRDMSYDGLDRLLTARSTGLWGGTFNYTYDVLDNIQTIVRPGQSLRYCYDTAHWRLSFIRSGSTNCSDGSATTTLAYDLQGNVAGKNNVTYAFDYGNRLRSTSGGAVSSYVYDGNGRRVRDYTTATKYSLYNQAGQLAFTSDYRKTEFANYIYLGGSLVALRTWPHGTSSFTTKYQHTDALGSPVAVTDASGVVVERNIYEPYGKSASPDDKPGYTGHVEDAATGLTYMQQRYYDPTIGRFLSVDPVTPDGATGANFSRYWYANNNPYRFTDPDGRFAEKDDKTHKDDPEPQPKPIDSITVVASKVSDALDYTDQMFSSVLLIKPKKLGDWTKMGDGGFSRWTGPTMRQWNRWKRVAKVGSVLSTLSMASNATKAINAAADGDKATAVDAGANTVVGAIGTTGPFGAWGAFVYGVTSEIIEIPTVNDAIPQWGTEAMCALDSGCL